MKHIILAGLPYDTNLGDPAIIKATRMMIEGFFEENGEECFCHEVDLKARTDRSQTDYRNPLFRFRLFLCNKGKKMIARCFLRGGRYYRTCHELTGKAVKLIVERIAAKQRIDALVFAGGGLVKYKTQRYLMHSIVNTIGVCQKEHIPVMMSAIGIEDADLFIRRIESSTGLLVDALQKTAVKCITTRDDLESLRAMMQGNERIETARVADPVCSIGKYIPSTIRTEKPGTKRIGIGVVRGKLFSDNGVKFNQNQQLTYYTSLYRQLSEQGFQPVLFTNGLKEDESQVDLICKKLADEDFNQCPKRANCPSTAEELVSVISSFDAVISARMHASIIAYAYDIPALGLPGNSKVRRFFEIIGYPERILDPENIDAVTTIKALRNALEEGYRQEEKSQYTHTTEAMIDDFLKRYVVTD